MLVHRQQAHRGDARRLQVRDGGIAGQEPAKLPRKRLGHAGMALREPLTCSS